MGVGYFEAMLVPLEVIMRDLDYMSYESTYGQREMPDANKPNGK